MKSGSTHAIGAAVTIVFATAIGMGQTANPRMVEDVFKNVQALKGIGVDDFMLTMGIMSAAVGSDCVGCHPSAGTDSVDWALDTPRKRTARRMIQMVTTINRDNFNGRQVVTCWTCHRGRDRPVTTMTLDVVYGPATDESDDVLAQAQGAPSVDQVLDKYLQAIGGAQNVARVTSFVATGKSVGYRGFGGGGLVSVSAQAPDKRATHITFPEYPDRGVSARTYDGRTGWIATPLAVVRKYELAGSERDGARLDAMLSFPTQIKQALTSLRIGPPTTIGDKDVTVLQGNGPNGTLATLYFDDASGLLVRMVRHGRSPIGRVPTQVDYSDYRDAGGIKFPFRWTFAWLDGRDDFEFGEVQLNVPIDAAKFGEPNVAAAPPKGDAAFADFFQARTAREAEAAADRIVASGIGFDETFARLRQGRLYSRDVARGLVQGSHRGESGEYFYTLDVPESYDPARKYQVRVQLHGGVGRIESSTSPRPGSRLPGVEQIYVMPSAWRDAPWWSGRQVDNLRAILDVVKRTYNVDENRVALSGVSDGGTGAYYMAMRDTTPFASFLPLNGFILVLENERAEADGDLFPNNLLNKPLFIVNGGRDPMYPTSAVDPYVEHLKRSGVDLVYRPQPSAGHDTSWWPEIKDAFERFVADHPRKPLPDSLTWESGPPNIPSRAHWLVIDRLAGSDVSDVSDSLAGDVNRMSTHPALDFGIRASGTRINRVVKGSSAEQIGLRPGDIVAAVNGQAIEAGLDVAELLRGYPSGRPVMFIVTRGGESVRLTGRFAPTALPGESAAMFPRQRESGRIDLARHGNSADVKSRGVAAFTLLLSPDQFDLNRAVTVVVNGRTLFDGNVQKDIRTLLKWAARDNDRTMLFAGELHVAVP